MLPTWLKPLLTVLPQQRASSASVSQTLGFSISLQTENTPRQTELRRPTWKDMKQIRCVFKQTKIDHRERHIAMNGPHNPPSLLGYTHPTVFVLSEVALEVLFYEHFPKDDQKYGDCSWWGPHHHPASTKEKAAHKTQLVPSTLFTNLSPGDFWSSLKSN